MLPPSAIVAEPARTETPPEVLMKPAVPMVLLRTSNGPLRFTLMPPASWLPDSAVTDMSLPPVIVSESAATAMADPELPPRAAMICAPDSIVTAPSLAKLETSSDGPFAGS